MAILKRFLKVAPVGGQWQRPPSPWLGCRRGASSAPSAPLALDEARHIPGLRFYDFARQSFVRIAFTMLDFGNYSLTLLLFKGG